MSLARWCLQPWRDRLPQINKPSLEPRFAFGKAGLFFGLCVPVAAMVDLIIAIGYNAPSHVHISTQGDRHG